MKKTRTYLTLISIAWLLAACGVDIVAPADLLKQTDDLQSAENAIVFSAGLEAVNTKAADEVTPNTDLNGKSIGVFAAYTGDVKYNLTTVSPNYMFNQQVEYDGTNWTYTPIKYWPNTLDADGDAQDYVSFFCYYPYISSTAAAAATTGGIIGFSNNNAQGDPWLVFQIPTGAPSIQTDLMYGVSSTGKPLLDIQKQSLTGKVDFTLRHALACVGDSITIKCPDDFKNALKDAAKASSDAHNAAVTFSVYLNKITIDYKNLTSKAKLILNSDTTPNWQPVYSGEQITSRSINISDYSTDKTYIHEGVAHEPIITATSGTTPETHGFIIKNKGLFYIPMHTGTEGQKAEITVDYTTTVSWEGGGYNYTGTVSNSFTLAETPQGKEPFNLVFSPNLPVGLDIAAAVVTGIPLDFDVDNDQNRADDLYYSGLPQTPEPIVKYAGQTLVKDVDYTVEYSNNTGARRKNAENPPTVTIKGIGKYAGTKAIPFTIWKKQLIAMVHDVTTTYGTDVRTELDPLGYTITGFVNGETIISALSPNPSSPKPIPTTKYIKSGETFDPSNSPYPYPNADSYSEAIDLDIDETYDNYAISVTKKGKLTVQKAPLQVIGNNLMIVYGENDPTYDKMYSIVGFVNSDDESDLQSVPNYTIVGRGYSTYTPAGSYRLELDDHATLGENTNYYFASFTDGNLIVKKAPLIITADDKVKTYGTAVEASTFLTYHITGLITPDTEFGDEHGVFSTRPQCSIPTEYESALTATGAVGTYPIVVAGGVLKEPSNYTITYNNAALTINKYVVTDANWSVVSDLNMTKGASTLNVLTISSYGTGPVGCPQPSNATVEVKYSSNNSNVEVYIQEDKYGIRINSNASPGTATVTFSLEGANYYYGSKSITITISSGN